MNENFIMKIILALVVIGMIYLFFRTNNENFDTTTTAIAANSGATSPLWLDSIKDEINKQYNMDIEAMRNLGAISKSLLTGTNYHNTSTIGKPGDLTIPADNTNLMGKLNVTGSVSFLPRGTVLMWFSNTAIPTGWRICDGGDGSPDLRGRFVLGSGGSRPYNTVGGEETHQLSTDEMPYHAHAYNFSQYSLRDVWNGGDRQGPLADGRSYHLDTSGPWNTTTYAGSNQPHNNMPPYYVLIYIYRTI